MQESELPDTLTHFTAPGAYRSIFRYGLSPASELVANFGVRGKQAEQLTKEPRPDFVTLGPDEKRGAARLSPHRLIVDGSQVVMDKCLAKGGATMAEYMELLADRIFFWTDEVESANYQALIAAGGEYDRINIRTKTLLRLAADQGREVQVSRYNSASVPRTPVVRGRATWVPISDMAKNNVKELAIEGGIEQLADATTSVTRFHPDGSTTREWAGGSWE